MNNFVLQFFLAVGSAGGRFGWGSGFLACFLLLVTSPSNLSASDPLRYRLSPDQVVHYRVKITVETPSSMDVMQGVLRFTGQKAEGGHLFVLFKGGLDKTSRAKEHRGADFFGKREHRGLTQTDSSLVIDPRGRVLKMQGHSQLPMMLGNASTLPWEPLPEGAQTKWESDAGILIMESNSSTAAEEKAVYEVAEDDGKRVTIRRHYKLLAPAVDASDLEHFIDGTGTLVFNRELGINESFEGTQDLVLRRDKVTITLPMTIAWHRMNQAEIALHEKQLAADAEKQRLQATKYERPIDPAEKKKSIAKLRSSNWEEPYRLLISMRRSIRKELAPVDVDVAVQIGLLRAHRNAKVRQAAEAIWTKWGAAVEKHGTAEDKAQAAAAAAKATEYKRIAADEMAAAKADRVNPETKKVPKPSTRAWSDRRGTLILEAAFLRMDRSRVVFLTRDGKEVRVPKARLSKQDQATIENLSK